MRYLVDTHALLWARSAPDRLSPRTLALFEDPGSALFVSIASLWECAIKSTIGKLVVPADFYRSIAEDYEILGIEVAHIEAYASLPLHHRDPFDRLLVAQAQLADLTVITRDRHIPLYAVSVQDA